MYRLDSKHILDNCLLLLYYDRKIFLLHVCSFFSKFIINNDIVDFINNTKFLGVIIDNKLNWAAHTLYMKSKISKSIGILLKIRKFLQNNTMRNMYFTFMYSYLIYCIEVWGNAHQTHLDPLIKMQKKSILTITFSHYLAHTEPLFLMQRISLIMFKNHLNILLTPLNNLFRVNNTRYEYFTRQHNDLHINIGLKEGVYKLFSFHGIHIWNHISQKNLHRYSYACFKNLSKNYIFI